MFYGIIRNYAVCLKRCTSSTKKLVNIEGRFQFNFLKKKYSVFFFLPHLFVCGWVDTCAHFALNLTWYFTGLALIS